MDVNKQNCLKGVKGKSQSKGKGKGVGKGKGKGKNQARVTSPMGIFKCLYNSEGEEEESTGKPVNVFKIKMNQKAGTCDKKCQTEVSWVCQKPKKVANASETESESPSVETPVGPPESETELLRCPICLEAYSVDLQPWTTKCGHPLCLPCLKRLCGAKPRDQAAFSLYPPPVPKVRCPHCRTEHRPSDYVRLNLDSFQSVQQYERRRLKDQIEDVKNDCLTSIKACIDEWHSEELNKLKCVPKVVNKSSLSKNIPLLVENVSVQANLAKAVFIKCKLKEAISSIEQLLTVLNDKELGDKRKEVASQICVTRPSVLERRRRERELDREIAGENSRW